MVQQGMTKTILFSLFFTLSMPALARIGLTTSCVICMTGELITVSGDARPGATIVVDQEAISISGQVLSSTPITCSVSRSGRFNCLTLIAIPGVYIFVQYTDGIEVSRVQIRVA